MKRPKTHHVMTALWGIAALSLLTAYGIQWGPRPTANAELILHLTASSVEMLAVVLLLRARQHALAANLLALVGACVITIFWAARATPSGAGVVHVIWLMLVLVVLAGRLGWDLFVRVLDRPRQA